MSLIILAITLSIDSFSIGMTYGLRNIKIPCTSKVILFAISFVIVLASISIGSLFLYILPDCFSRLLGGLLLSLTGMWIFVQSNQCNSDFNQIINEPKFSDFDDSKTIDSKEALCLAIAMSADSLICGIGTGLDLNFPLFFPLLVSGFQMIFLSLGTFLGKKIKSIFNISSATLNKIAGIILFLFGIAKMI